jgi:hypothetical protein
VWNKISRKCVVPSNQPSHLYTKIADGT